MLRSWLGDWIGTFLGLSSKLIRHALRLWLTSTLGHKGAVWSSKISLDTSRAVTGSADFTAYVASIFGNERRLIWVHHRKIWDTNSGEALHTFAHNHIVRSVALNPQSSPQYLLTVSSLLCRVSSCTFQYCDPTILWNLLVRWVKTVPEYDSVFCVLPSPLSHSIQEERR
jgi:WD40 repeat protein